LYIFWLHRWPPAKRHPCSTQTRLNRFGRQLGSAQCDSLFRHFWHASSRIFVSSRIPPMSLAPRTPGPTLLPRQSPDRPTPHRGRIGRTKSPCGRFFALFPAECGPATIMITRAMDKLDFTDKDGRVCCGECRQPKGMGTLLDPNGGDLMDCRTLGCPNNPDTPKDS
jgi:hypothetical protein